MVETDTLTGVNLVADDITAGTLSVDRLIFRGSEKSIIYELNNISGALQAVSSETLNGEIITPRSITADRIAAKSITANEINVTDLRSTGFIGANKLTAANIEVDDLRALGATIGGFRIGTTALYNNIMSMDSTGSGVYVGIDGIKSANAYYQCMMSDGRLILKETEETLNGLNSIIYPGGLLLASRFDNGYYQQSITDGAIDITKVVLQNETTGITYNIFHVNEHEMSFWGVDAENKAVELMNVNKKGILEAIGANIGSYKNDSYALATSSFICNDWIRTKGSTGWYNQDYGGGWYMTDANFIRNYNNKSVLLSGSLCFGSASYYVNNSGGAKLASVTAGTLTSTGRVYAVSKMGFTAGYSADTVEIYCIWKDGKNHDVLIREADGLTMRLGWYGSASYKTVLQLRGQTVQYRNASGTTTLSDERLKNSFKNLNEYDDAFMNMKPVAFRYNNGASGRFHFGFKAQNIRDALLKAGFTTQDFGGIVQMEDDPTSEDYCGVPDPLGLIYTEFTAWNTHMIQKTALRVNRHDEEILELRQRVNDLERRLETAEQKAVA